MNEIDEHKHHVEHEVHAEAAGDDDVDDDRDTDSFEDAPDSSSLTDVVAPEAPTRQSVSLSHQGDRQSVFSIPQQGDHHRQSLAISHQGDQADDATSQADHEQLVHDEPQQVTASHHDAAKYQEKQHESETEEEDADEDLDLSEDEAEIVTASQHHIIQKPTVPRADINPDIHQDPDQETAVPSGDIHQDTNQSFVVPSEETHQKITLPGDDIHQNSSLPSEHIHQNTTLPNEDIHQKTTLPSEDIDHHTTLPDADIAHNTTLPNEPVVHNTTLPTENSVQNATLEESATGVGAEESAHHHDTFTDEEMSPPDHARKATLESVPELPPAVPAKEPRNEPIKGLSGDLPSFNYPPPPPPPHKSQTSPIPPPPPSRKLSSPFGWFARARKATSPSRPASPRRNTASSLNTLGSNPEIADDTSPSHQPALKDSLKDRFHILRLQGESSVAAEDGPNLQNTRQTRAGSLQSPTKEEHGALSPPFTPRANSFSALSSPTTTRLPPGTAAGVAQGPPEDQGAVNWDLWQSVVYEGPSAVTRTSGDQLSRAIANGIPQPIRGVVWQVLADSKNEDLEQIYRGLVVRGTEKELPRPPPGPRHISSGPGVEKESLASSASSVHSNASTPATTMSPGLNGSESFNINEKRQSTRDEAAALQKLEKTIKRDLGARTAYSKYLASSGLQDGLYGICKAYALYDEAVGYAQGMNFIAMPILFNMPEEEAFTLFVRLMSKYNLRSLFTAEMTGLHLHLYQFERFLEDFEPALYCHLHRRGVPPNLYATQWFLTLFAYRFPLQLVLRVYDLVLSEGLGAILKFGIALMQRNAQTLLEMKDMVELSTHLKEKLFDVYIDKSPSASSIQESGFFGSASGVDKEVYRADELVRDACAVKLAPETLAAYASEFEEKTRTEQEREAELESLRVSNSNYITRVRNLEERAQQHDKEHVAIASDLVRTKVENDKLQDENESLKMQVQELRKMVDTQPAEVEERLKDEMERIMQRNIEVQNSNRALEETVQETEQELVGTKMMYAQLNAEHDALKQKLANVQSLLNGTDKRGSTGAV